MLYGVLPVTGRGWYERKYKACREKSEHGGPGFHSPYIQAPILQIFCKYSASCRDSSILTLGKKLTAGTEEALDETAAGLSLKPLLG